jgi:S-adenosylmethionine:tRNA ribosyltransferase-isomerase
LKEIGLVILFSMLISDFDYYLPDELIAQEPLLKREESRMLVVDRGANSTNDDQFANLPEYLRKGDIVVMNNTKVFPARLLGQSETGANVELFLVTETQSGIWETLARPARRLSIGKRIHFGEKLTAEVLEKTTEGRCVVRFEAIGDFDEVLEEVGKTPLPPYIKREKDALDRDRERYQTIFASERGAIAAPTAGLHFTPEVVNRIREAGAEVAEITLHVGYGTFEPVRVSRLSEHSVMPENCSISTETAEKLNQIKANGGRIIAIGTTTTRALESSVSNDGLITPGQRLANLTITPGYRFRAIDGLLTNFHLPQSSLLVLVSTFAGHDLIMNSYRHAVSAKYRFYSYGDCMLIL